MIVRKCSRCGKYFDDTPKDKDRNAVVLARMGKGSDVLFNYSSVSDIFDLCPSCMNELKAWIKNDKVEASSDGG